MSVLSLPSRFRTTFYGLGQGRIVDALNFPFQFASAGTSQILSADGALAIVEITLWANAANTWRIERSEGGVLKALLPAAGSAFSFAANQGYLNRAIFTQDCEGEIIILPVASIRAGDGLQLTRGGSGEIVGNVQAIPVERR